MTDLITLRNDYIDDRRTVGNFHEITGETQLYGLLRLREINICFS